MAAEAAPLAATSRAGGSTLVLAMLAAGQFLMALDASVMNVSIATVAEDVGTTVTGIQGAITAYTLVMASLMVTGGKVGALIGRRRAFAIGCVIYAMGSTTTALSQSLPVLLFGWSFLEGVGAALIMPAIVALIAGNFPTERRPAAYGLVAAAAAIAIAVGPILGGFATTYFSWRWIFAGEAIIVAVILVLSRKIADAPVTERPRIDVLGVVLSIAGLGSLVFAVLRSGEWGWVQPRPEGPSWLGMSPTIWLLLAAAVIIWLFFAHSARLDRGGGEPLIRPSMLRNRQLDGGLLMFFFQFLVQMGVFFVIPLFLSVVLGLSALDTGLRLLPLSLTLLAAALAIPRLAPDVSPRLVVRVGLVAMGLGTILLAAAMDADAGPEVVSWPLALLGLGMGALASQLGNVAVSAVPDEQSSEVGGVQNTMTNLGASLGTALAGSILIASLSTSLAANIDANPDVPDDVKRQADVRLASGVPFLSDDDLEEALTEADVAPDVQQEIVTANSDARLDGLRSALGVLALFALLGLFFTPLVPRTQPRGPPAV